jgi:hypothetical protein
MLRPLFPNMLTSKTKPIQLSLNIEIQKNITYRLDIEPVPDEIALGENRYHIISKRFLGDELAARYQVPGQWTKQEVVILHQDIKGLLWQIPEDDFYCNRPRANDEIHLVCQQFCRKNRDFDILSEDWG